MYDYQLPDAGHTAWVLVSQTRAAMHRLAEGLLAKVGLSPERFQVLSLCSNRTLIPAEIARSMLRASQSVAGLLNRMERDGLVARVLKRPGHPFTEIQITPQGEELLRVGLEVAVPLIDKVMSSLSAEQLEELQKLLRVIRQDAIEALRMEIKPAPSSALLV